MKKLFIVSDVHGFFTEMKKALDEKGFDINNPNHVFVSCGDLLDRGREPEECLDFVNGLPDNRKILIYGNHEDLMVQLLLHRRIQSHDIHNGTLQTIKDIVKDDSLSNRDLLRKFEANNKWNEYIYKTNLYAEVGKNIFVHGWIPVETVEMDMSDSPAYDLLPNIYRPTEKVYKQDWREAPFEYWYESMWLNGMSCWDKGIREYGSTIWCGHWHTSWGHAYLHNDGVEFVSDTERSFFIDAETGEKKNIMNSNPFIDEGIVAMDACTALVKRVNCEVIEVEDTEFNNRVCRNS